MDKIFISKKLYYDIYKVGKRTIYAPCKDLKKIQKSILEIIRKHYSLKLSIQKTASAHTNKKWLLKMDIKGFYESVTKEQIECCINRIFVELDEPFKYTQEEVFKYCTIEGKLPTGGVTSAHIANMVMSDIDKVLAEYCKRCKVKFSRYMDDLFFSSDSKEDLMKFEKLTEKILKAHHFEINPEKTKYISKNKRQEVLGIVVNNKNAKIPYDVKKEYRAIFYNYIKSIYLEEHFAISTLLLRKYNFHHINGYLAYIKCCDKEYFETIKVYINKLLGRYKINGKNKEINSLKKVIS